MIDKYSYILDQFSGSKVSASGELTARCPFHHDSTPSFSINLNTGLWLCRSASCGLRGNFAKFYKLIEGISWREVKEVLSEVDISVSIEDLLENKKEFKKDINKINEFPYEPCIEPLGVIKYLANRNLGRVIIDSFGLVYGKIGIFDNLDISKSIVVPVFDVDQTYKTFQIRYLGKEGKRWMIPDGSPAQKLLYGGWFSFNQGDLWIVEGCSDVWNLYNHGIQSVGLFTKSASSAQLNRINKLCEFWGLRPIICLDGDAKSSAEKLFMELSGFGLDPEIVYLNPSEDPGSLSAERISELFSQFL